MAARHVFALTLGIAFSSSLLLAPKALLAEEEQATPQVDNARYQFIGRITSNAVFVRSGPSNNFYPTMKLDKNAKVTVVGMKYDWLKILPPEGSFSFVPQVFVDRRGDGKVGRVNNTLNVRAGSGLNGMKTIVQVKLEPGQDVQILDAQEEYFKIAPPEGAYVYVNKQYVEPIKRVDQPGQPEQPKVEIANKADPEGAAVDPAGTTQQSTEPGAGDTGGDVAVSQTPDKAGADGRLADAGPIDAATSTTKPVIDDFRTLEAEFKAASELPPTDQPIDQLAERYTRLAKSGTVTGTNKRIVDARLVALKFRAQARAGLEDFKKSQKEMHDRQAALRMEKEEIDKRIEQTEVSLYTAVGTLRVSSLQHGSTTLYRLTDPTSGRTVVYLRSNDPKYAGLLNQFVGVRGELATDQRLKMKIITPTEAERVDPSKVNGTVIATITPPGMIMSSSASVDQGDAGN